MIGIDAARPIAGALLVDKPAGPTSHDIVAFVRRTLKVDRAGHTGTLDPLATGLLIVLVGSATRLAQFLAADEKEYIADVRLGIATPTYDAAGLEAGGASGEGRREAREIGEVTEKEIESVLDRFRGTFLQTPPPYSAKKIASVPAYEMARRNQTVELKPVEVTVRRLEVIDPLVSSAGSAASAASASHLAPHASPSAPPASLLRLRVTASAGFYVRSLAHDIGQALGCGAHLEGLRRMRVGRFRVEDALTLDRVDSDATARLIPSSDLLGQMPAVVVTEDGARRVAHGNPVTCQSGVRQGSDWGQTGVRPVSDPSLTPVARHVRLVDGAGTLLAVAEARPGGLLQPVVVLR